MTKEEIEKEIKELEQKHLNFCGYKASECGCCESEIKRLKHKLKEQTESREDEFGFCKGCGYIPEKCSCGETAFGETYDY